MENLEVWKPIVGFEMYEVSNLGNVKSTLGLTDVMKFSQEGHITGDYEHPTVKPEKLSRALILTCSRPNDLVVVPFAGSGTECAMAAKEGRQFIGFETEARYVEMANKRIQMHKNQLTLFA